MKELTVTEIEAFASRPNVRRVAVENALMSCHHNHTTPEQALANARVDAKLYRWNNETLRAIIDGITLATNK